jgi:hypothetical protein
VLVNQVLEFKEIRDQPAVQKLLLLLPRIMPCMDKALAHVRHIVPFLSIFLAQALQQLPQFLASANWEWVGHFLSRKLACLARRACRGGEGRRQHCMFRRGFGFGQGRACGQSPASPSPSPSPASASSGVHSDIQCDGCNQFPLVGVRYKCTVCPDYDLCASCEAKNQHPAEHPLLKLKEAPQSDVHYGVTCDGCGAVPIHGPRYKCTVCPNFDLCGACESKGIHDPTHALLKLKVRRGGGGGCHRGRWGHGPHGRHAGGPHGPHAAGPFGPFGPFRGGCGRRRFQCPREGKEDKKDEKQESSQFNATFVRDVNFADGSRVFAGQTLVKEWEFVNPEGSPRWPEGAKLVYSEGDKDILGGQEEFPLTLAAPGQKVTVSVSLPIPKNVAGRRKTIFRLVDSERKV